MQAGAGGGWRGKWCSYAAAPPLSVASNWRYNFRNWSSLIHELFSRVFWSMDLVDWDSYFVFILRIKDWKIILKFLVVFCWFWMLKRIAQVLLLHRFNGGPDSVVLLLRFFLKMPGVSVRILDTMLCLGTWLWLFSQACYALKVTLEGWLHLSFHGHWPICPHWFRCYNCGCPGLMLEHLWPIPDVKYLPFYQW